MIGPFDGLVFQRAAVAAERLDQAIEHVVSVGTDQVAEPQLLQRRGEPVACDACTEAGPGCCRHRRGGVSSGRGRATQCGYVPA